jgi:hypothetical protein
MKPALSEAVRIFEKIRDSEGVKEAIEGKLSYDQLEALYLRCAKLLKVFGIDKIIPSGMEAVRIESEGSGSLGMIVRQVRKLGDSLVTERLGAYEAGESLIEFRDMDEGTEGYTRTEGGKTVYSLNRKYERIGDNRTLQKASIILAHELQRNPWSGDLKGETAEIVCKDVEYIEKLADEYGEGVYRNNPEFGILHYIKEIIGDGGLKEFVDEAFSHTGSYWKINRNGDLECDGAGAVRGREGNALYDEGRGLQVSLESWLGMEAGDGWKHLMEPAGFKYNEDGGSFKWTATATIVRKLIDDAWKAGKIGSAEAYKEIGKGEIQQIANSEAMRMVEEILEEAQTGDNTQGPGGKILTIIREGALAQVEMQNKQNEMAVTAVDNVKQAMQGFWAWITGGEDKENNEEVNQKDVSSGIPEDIEETSVNYAEENDQEPKSFRVPEGFYNQFTVDSMKDFWPTSKDETKCNKFLPYLLEKLGPKVYSDIFPNGEEQKAHELDDAFKSNSNLQQIIGVGNTELEKAASAANKAQEFANAGHLVITALDTTSDGHVSAIGPQSLTYGTYPPQAWAGDATPGPAQSGNGYGTVLVNYPVFVQAGAYTGVVTPGYAQGRDNLTRNKVLYFLYEPVEEGNI